MTKTISILPPQIIAYYDRLLLSKPYPLFRDTSKVLLQIFQYISKKLSKKCKFGSPNDEKRLQKYLNLQNKFMELYERAKIKEEELKENSDHHTQRPFYYFPSADRYNRKVFARLRLKSQRNR